MTIARLEHANITVADPDKTAAWMADVFGWHVRWQGVAMENGRTIHIGGDDNYIALYNPGVSTGERERSYETRGGLNHLAVVVEDLNAVEAKVHAAGFKSGQHYDYEPGERFYFWDNDGIEYEVVHYG